MQLFVYRHAHPLTHMFVQYATMEYYVKFET